MLSRAYPPGHFSTNPAFGQRRAIGLNLVVFFFFALTALVCLTRAAVAANAINRDVASAIEPATIGISQSTSRIPVLDKTVKLTGKIEAAVMPLSAHLDGVVDSTARITSNASETNNDVLAIGESVSGINRSTGAIKPAIGTLGGHVSGIHAQVGDVTARLNAVADQTASMVRNLTTTNESLAYVLSATKPLKRYVNGIDSSIALINVHTRRIADSPILLRDGLDLNALLGDILGGA